MYFNVLRSAGEPVLLDRQAVFSCHAHLTPLQSLRWLAHEDCPDAGPANFNHYLAADFLGQHAVVAACSVVKSETGKMATWHFFLAIRGGWRP